MKEWQHQAIKTKKVGEYATNEHARAAKLLNMLDGLKQKAELIGDIRKGLSSISDPIKRRYEEVEMNIEAGEIMEDVAAIRKAAGDECDKGELDQRVTAIRSAMKGQS